MSTKVWAFLHFKGGVGKSTATMFSALALNERGYDVHVLDADYATQSLTEWCHRAYREQIETGGHGLPIDSSQWNPRFGGVEQHITTVVNGAEAPDFLLVDLAAEDPQMVERMAWTLNLAVTPTSADPAELARLDATRQALGQVPHLLLLNKVPRKGMGRAKEARELWSPHGFKFIDEEVTRDSGLYADSFGSLPEDLGAYPSVVAELIDHSRSGQVLVG